MWFHIPAGFISEKPTDCSHDDVSRSAFLSQSAGNVLIPQNDKHGNQQVQHGITVEIKMSVLERHIMQMG